MNNSFYLNLKLNETQTHFLPNKKYHDIVLNIKIDFLDKVFLCLKNSNLIFLSHKSY